MAKKHTTPRTGPEPERVKIDGNWKAAMGKALQKPRPARGWPKLEAMPKAARSRKNG